MQVQFRTSGDFQDKTQMLNNRNISGISEPIGSMRIVPVKTEAIQKVGFDALLKTGTILSRSLAANNFGKWVEVELPPIANGRRFSEQDAAYSAYPFESSLTQQPM